MSIERRPIYCIVPPHILKKLLDHDDAPVRERALKTLLTTADLRGERRAVGPMASYLATATGGLRRTIYDGRDNTILPGTLICSEAGIGSTHDQDAKNAYEGLGDTYTFYKSVYHRNSIDNRGMRLDATVHYGQGYDNAFWNGTQMVFGDGDRQIFNDFTICLDVIGHELTHGVTQYECNLTYQGQSGALNESLSDVFGSLIKQYKERQTCDTADWLIGKGLLVHGEALRSMKAPGTAYKDVPVIGSDPQPGDMHGYVETDDDNGGVHLNSGIPNRAFYLTAEALGGFAWEQAGNIWYRALPAIPENATFQQAADLFYQTAVSMYGANSKQSDAVGNGWAQVGLPPTGSRQLAKPAAAMTGDSVEHLVDVLADRVIELVLERVSAQIDSKTRRPTGTKK